MMKRWGVYDVMRDDIFFIPVAHAPIAALHLKENCKWIFRALTKRRRGLA